MPTASPVARAPATGTSSRRQGAPVTASGTGPGSYYAAVLARHPPPQPFFPAADAQTFRDLLIFEERLKQNAARLVKRKKKYQSILVTLLGSCIYLSYLVLLRPSAWVPLHYLQVGLLLFCATTLFLFFASGMYSERIGAANRFVPQANRSLQWFNLYLNVQPQMTSPISTLLSGPSDAAAPPFPLAPTGSSLPTPTGGRRGSAQQAQASSVVAPPANPRGELIFAARVSASFREGYERYRAAFERRRSEKMNERQARTWRWLPGVPWRKAAAHTAAPGATEMGAAGAEKSPAAAVKAAHTRTTSTASRTGASANTARRNRKDTNTSVVSNGGDSASSSRASSPAGSMREGLPSSASQQAARPINIPTSSAGPAARAASRVLGSGGSARSTAAPISSTPEEATTSSRGRKSATNATNDETGGRRSRDRTPSITAVASSSSSPSGSRTSSLHSSSPTLTSSGAAGSRPSATPQHPLGRRTSARLTGPNVGLGLGPSLDPESREGTG